MMRTLRSIGRGECTACVLMGAIGLSSLIYWIAALVVRPDVLNDLVDGPLMTLSLAAGLYYLSWSMTNCHKVIDRAFMLRFGICLTWIGNFVWRVSRFMYAQGVLRGPIGAHDEWRGYMILIMAIGGFMHVIAIGMEGGRPRRSQMLAATACVAVGFAFMLGVHYL